MRALVTASFERENLRRLERLMEVVHEDWKRDRKIYFNGEEFAARIQAVGADVVIVEADLVHEEVLSRCRLRMIGCCRGDPINIDRDMASRQGVPIFFAPGRNAEAVADLTLSVPKRCIYGFIGPNSSGKTTTLRMIMRIYHPDPGSGAIRVLGEETSGPPPIASAICPRSEAFIRK